MNRREQRLHRLELRVRQRQRQLDAALPAIERLSWPEMLRLLDWYCQQHIDAATAAGNTEQAAVWGLRKGMALSISQLLPGDTFEAAVAPVEAWARHTLDQAGIPWPRPEP